MRTTSTWMMLMITIVAAITPGRALAASSWRCGSRLVGRGDSIADVYTRCGEPDDRLASTELVTVEVSPGVAVTRAVPIERWTYNPGPRQFVRALTFRDGALLEIDEGSYGY